MSTKNPQKQHARRAAPRGGAPSNQVHLPGTVGSTRPEAAIALMAKWAEEGNADEDRRAYEAVLQEIERARS